MHKLITADQFVLGLLCELRLRGITELKLSDSGTDRKFGQAYQRLVARSGELGVSPDFTIFEDRFHGDSQVLRETLYSARDKRIVAINNPSFKVVEIRLSEKSASEYLDQEPVARGVFSELVDAYFVGGTPGDISGESIEGPAHLP